MLKFILLHLSIIILLFGCKEPADELTFVPGEILIAPCDSVSCIKIYNLVDSLDFIINYDIKYRMGKALFGEENGEDEE